MKILPTWLFLLQTWTSRCLMKFYAVVAASPTSCENHKMAERIEQRILNSNPVMEAFGELSVLCCTPVPFPLGSTAFQERENFKTSLWVGE